MGFISKVKVPFSKLMCRHQKDNSKIRIRESEIDCLRFPRLKQLIMIKLRSMVFSGWCLFGFAQLPIILEVTLDAHFKNCGKEFRDVVKKVIYDMHVKMIW